MDWQQQTLSAIQSLHKKNIIVYVVSVGTFADPIVLGALTSPTPPISDPSLAADQAKNSGRVFDISEIGGLLKSLDALSIKVPKGRLCDLSLVLMFHEGFLDFFKEGAVEFSTLSSPVLIEMIATPRRFYLIHPCHSIQSITEI